MARKSTTTSCAICENPNLASVCASCVNYRLNEHSTSLKSLKMVRNSLHQKIERKLEAKKKMDEQVEWRVLQNEKIAKLKERLQLSEEQLWKNKAEVAKGKADLRDKSEVLDSAFSRLWKVREELLGFYRKLNCTQNLGLMAVTSELLHKQSVVIRQISKFFPVRQVISDGNSKDGLSCSYVQICNARLPRGLDPHSVSSEELAVSLGYMVQLLDFVIAKLSAPALHNSGFAGSSSRIWQRSSYWDARPSSQSQEYPLFIPRRSFCSSEGDTSWSDRSSSNFGVASVDSERKPYLDAGMSSSFNYSSASPHSVETHKDLQKGISLLKKSVACVTAYCFNSLCLDVPPEASTFDAFAKMLATLSSSKEMRSVLSLKMGDPRSDTQGQQLNKSAWDVNSAVSSSSLVGSTHTVIMPSTRDNLLSNSDASFLYSPEIGYYKKLESLVDGWDFVEHPTLPSPPSQDENVEQSMPAMFLDITKK
ncbi:uncharacterized protein M6B38_275575 [Iris pallida]|uniref:UV radiation resistance protein/autophagy-related protein 14 n=1 Tax=Iris pallida TaxID=29817 RepID=A0AAX6I6H5_IRIPA|nr:uncharacterized protein M6B38_275575 [Iris pallida]